MRALKTVLAVVMVLAAAGAGLYVTQRLMASPKTDISGGRADGDPVVVETIPAEMTRFSDVVRAVGTAHARQAVELMAEASGRITHLNLRPGEKVAKGEVLMGLDDRAEQASLKAAEASMAEAEFAFARQEQLHRNGSASDAAYQSAKASLLRAEAERDQARLELDERQLRAPFAGVVGLTDLVEGQLVELSTQVATLDDLSVIEVDFSVSETLLPQLKTGQRIEVTSPAWPGRIFEGHIGQIDTRVDAATRSISLRAEIPNDDRALTGGMFLQVRLVLDERERLAVPERFVEVEGERELIMLAEDGTVRQVEIETGQVRDGRIEIISGLTAGAQIIVTNLHRISPGMEVTVQPQNRQAEAQK